MLGWVSTVSRTLSRPVEHLDRTFGKRKSSAALGNDPAAAQSPVSSLREAAASGNGDTRHEWQTRGTDRSAVRWSALVQRQPMPQWKSANEGQAIPEWKTDLWKRRVEGEAKKRFDGEISGVGRLRS